MEQKLKQIKERVKKPKSKSLTMDRVDIKTWDWFKNFASEEFVDDYGMALKKLVEVYQSNYPPNNIAIVLMRLEEMEEQLNEFKQGMSINPEQEFNIIKTIGGKEIKVRKVNE